MQHLTMITAAGNGDAPKPIAFLDRTIQLRPDRFPKPVRSVFLYLCLTQ
jgi:hypothetical protein